MNIPIPWLKEYIDFKLSPDDLAERLTMTGTAIESVHGDLLEAEITTNRPDCLGLLGIAREVSAITGNTIKWPDYSAAENKKKETLKVTIKHDDCSAYTARIFENVSIGDSPKWLELHLEAMGLNPINNVVDITNFCLFETGQPLHAFDLDKLEGAELIVRAAKKGEKFIGINDITYELDPSVMVIADTKKAVAIAGVMGGKETEISQSTTRVALESAAFDPVSVRKTARKLKIATDSSHRFERGVPRCRVLQSSNRAGKLMAELAGAVAASDFFCEGDVKGTDNKPVTLTTGTLNRVLGSKVSLKDAEEILIRLGFEVDTDQDVLTAVAPEDRLDIELEADLVEEVVRIHGFDSAEESLPATKHSIQKDNSVNVYKSERRLREALCEKGFWETVTFSLVSEEALNRAKVNHKPIKILNALSLEQAYLRTSPIPSLLEAISHNVRRQEKDIAFFDIAKSFIDGKEVNLLSLAVTGEVIANWQTKSPASIFYLRGVIEQIFSLFGKELPACSEGSYPFCDALEDAITFASGKTIGYCGRIPQDIAQEWRLVEDVFYAELNLDEFLNLPTKQKQFSELPKHPAVHRDLAFVVGSEIKSGELEALMKQAAGDDLKDVRLFDVYQGKSIPKGKRSLAYSLLYQKPDSTYTDDEIQKLQDAVIKALTTTYQIEIRS